MECSFVFILSDSIEFSVFDPFIGGESGKWSSYNPDWNNGSIHHKIPINKVIVVSKSFTKDLSFAIKRRKPFAGLINSKSVDNGKANGDDS